MRPICLIAAATCALAHATTAQTFALDTDYTTGMAILDLDILIDAPIGSPVYIGAYELCHQNDGLFAVALARIQNTDLPIGLVEVTRQENGAVTVIIPEIEDPYGDDFLAELEELGEDYAAEFADEFEDYDPFYEDDRLIALWTLLQSIPCDDWRALTADPATLLPVTSIDGATSMSELLATTPPAE